jgi:hypothetical protein
MRVEANAALPIPGNMALALDVACLPAEFPIPTVAFNPTDPLPAAFPIKVADTPLVLEPAPLPKNRLLELANGSYIVILGDDDELDENYLSSFFSKVSQNKNVFVFHCRSYIIDSLSNITSINPSLPEFETFFDFLASLAADFIGSFLLPSPSKSKKSGLLPSLNSFFSNSISYKGSSSSSFISRNLLKSSESNLPLLFLSNLCCLP